MIIYQYINVHIYVWGGTIIKVLYEQCVDAHICMCQTYNIVYQHCIDAHICVLVKTYNKHISQPWLPQYTMVCLHESVSLYIIYCQYRGRDCFFLIDVQDSGPVEVYTVESIGFVNIWGLLGCL